jgi:hypothetical protein
MKTNFTRHQRELDFLDDRTTLDCIAVAAGLTLWNWQRAEWNETLRLVGPPLLVTEEKRT